MKSRVLGISLFLAGTAVSTALADWTSFRNGGESSVAALPKEWSPDSVAWQKELEGYGQSTPIIQGQQIFVASVVGTQKESCLIECIDLANGQRQWKYEMESAKKSPSNYMASRAAPTPVVDSQGVYVFFETGDLVAVDLSGKKMWSRVLSEEFGEFDNNHGLGSSPAQNESHLFLNLEHRGPSYLIAIAKATGKTDWKAERPSGSSWSSPIVASIGESEQVIVSSAGSVVSYQAASGEENWKVEGLDGNSVPSPTLLSKRLFIGARLPEFAEEGSIRSNCCLDLATAPGESPKVAWRADKAISDYASPVIAAGNVYFINKVGVLTCLDVDSGKQNYRHRLAAPCWATPIVSGDSVYFFCKDGTTQVIQAGDTFELTSSSSLWDPSSPPKPESYVEFAGGGHGHGSRAGSGTGPGSGASSGGGQGRRPGGGMIAALMQGDANGDGILEGEEVPANFRGMLSRIDKNQDGKLDKQELDAMAKSFAERRSGSQASARDPIVYGAAASAGSLVIRTGTRLYCIQN